jgi:hypothetical protein
MTGDGELLSKIEKYCNSELHFVYVNVSVSCSAIEALYSVQNSLPLEWLLLLSMKTWQHSVWGILITFKSALETLQRSYQ